MGVQVGQILRQAARFAPEATAVIDLGHTPAARREFSFASLHRMACAVAETLAERGVAPGDRVAIVAENSAEVAAAWFGVVYAGAAVVPLNLLSAAPELRERLAHAGAKLVLHDAPRADLVRQALVDHTAAAACELSAIDYQTQPTLDYPLDASPADTAMVLYTSGTTGRPKGAAITHASLMLHTLLLVQHALQLDERSRVLCTLPLSHSYGCRLALLAPFYARASIVTVPRFDATRTLQAVRDEGVTWLPGVPTMFASWGQLTAAGAFPSLRWALCAGAPLADATALRAEAVLGVPVRQGYGMTEATFATMNAPPDARVLGSVGKPIWGVELRIVDTVGEDGAQLPAGKAGEVLVRGHNVMQQYLFDPEATAEALPGGWVRSGDVGMLDAEGRLTIVDRIKDLIIRGGYNVYPSEVENVLGAHPGVHDVAVVGRRDDHWGEEVVAVIVARAAVAPTVAELHAFAAPKLSRTKLPREYAFTNALPLGGSGKVQKRTLRTWLESGELRVEKAPP